ncbi:MAG: hypothetical protein A2Y40_02510 [Candidatus Margulisbacteria bacterium GWF2_35_9]|nr:MAG: hypothetical protein A2Y40_02510 [Candidatus Margulisbacteria bacterium GWF2_35_9]
MTVNAAIDLGTNSLRLIIAEVSHNKINVLKETSYMCRVGQSLQKTGFIKEDVMARIHEHLLEIKELLNQYQVKSVHFVATSALRDAKNASEFNDMVTSTGLKMEIISGIKEAQIIAKAVHCYVPNISNNSIFIDQGGGSVEFIHFIPGNETYCSLDLGIVRLTEQFFAQSPPTDKEVSKFKEFNLHALNQNLKPILNSKPDQLIVLGGTGSTLAMIYNKLTVYDSQIVHKTVINLSFLKGMIQDLQSLTSSEIQTKYSLAEKRSDIFFSGVLQIYYWLTFFNVDSFIVCDKGLRYGLLLD